MKQKIVVCLMTLLMVTVGFSAFGVTSKNTSNNLDETVVWDNGMNYDDIGKCQVDDSVNYDIFAADDFYLEEEMEVFACRAIEGYHGPNYLQANFNWSVEFYIDRGDGDAPGEIFAGPFIFTHDRAKPIVIEDTGSAIYYEFTFEFPNPLIFSATQKYWVNIYGIGALPTQCGAVYHYSPIKLHQIVGKSEYFGFSEWENAEDISPHLDQPVDACFQLLTYFPPSIPDIIGASSGKTGESQDYTFSSIDPEGEDVKYCIDWGDGSEEICIGPFPSGDEITQSHIWTEDGDYTLRIKAQDSQGLESEYGTLVVSMPKAKVISPWLFRFLDNYPFLSSLIERLLEES